MGTCTSLERIALTPMEGQWLPPAECLIDKTEEKVAAVVKRMCREALTAKSGESEEMDLSSLGLVTFPVVVSHYGLFLHHLYLAK